MRCRNGHVIPNDVRFCALCGAPRRRTLLRRTSVRLAFFVLVIVAGSLAGFEWTYRDRIYPGVRVQVPAGTVNTGGMTVRAAEKALQAFSIKQRFRIIHLTAHAHAEILVPVYKLGYGLDGDLTATHAYAIGRDRSALDNARTQWDALTRSTRVALVQRVDVSVLDAYLFKLAPSVALRPQRTATGRRLDVVSTERAIARALTTGSTSRIPLKFITVPHLAAR